MNFRKIISFTLIAAFIGSSLYVPQAQAGEMVMPVMPKPGIMVNLSPAYTPAYLKGIVIHPENALKFDFLVHKGDGNLDQDQKKEEYNKLIKYFLASLTVPDKDQWVNLSPYEKNRIIADDFGKTEMGRDLLGQDYLLKQITASLMYPESGLGKNFWDKVYERAFKEYGSTNIPVNTFNKVWIVPDEALIYESGNTAYVVKSHLKVMLEEDYLSLKKHTAITGVIASGAKQSLDTKAHTVASKVIKEIILPEIEREVNEGKNFSMLRQVFSGMVLATWYKMALKESLLGKVYADKAKVQGVNQDPKNNEEIYQRYLRAFKKGVYNYIKEDTDKYTNQVIPRKYFAGGAYNNFAQISEVKKVTGPVMDAAMGADKDQDIVAMVADPAQSMSRRRFVTEAAATAAAVGVAGVGAVLSGTEALAQKLVPDFIKLAASQIDYQTAEMIFNKINDHDSKFLLYKGIVTKRQLSEAGLNADAIFDLMKQRINMNLFQEISDTEIRLLYDYRHRALWKKELDKVFKGYDQNKILEIFADSQKNALDLKARLEVIGETEREIRYEGRKVLALYKDRQQVFIDPRLFLYVPSKGVIVLRSPTRDFVIDLKNGSIVDIKVGGDKLDIPKVLSYWEIRSRMDTLFKRPESKSYNFINTKGAFLGQRVVRVRGEDFPYAGDYGRLLVGPEQKYPGPARPFFPPHPDFLLLSGLNSMSLEGNFLYVRHLLEYPEDKPSDPIVTVIDLRSGKKVDSIPIGNTDGLTVIRKKLSPFPSVWRELELDKAIASDEAMRTSTAAALAGLVAVGAVTTPSAAQNRPPIPVAAQEETMQYPPSTARQVSVELERVVKGNTELAEIWNYFMNTLQDHYAYGSNLRKGYSMGNSTETADLIRKNRERRVYPAIELLNDALLKEKLWLQANFDLRGLPVVLYKILKIRKDGSYEVIAVAKNGTIEKGKNVIVDPTGPPSGPSPVVLSGGNPESKDRAQTANPFGGIDLNAANLDLQIKRDGNGVPLPISQQDMTQLSQIGGFVPRILEIRPASSLPFLKEIK